MSLPQHTSGAALIKAFTTPLLAVTTLAAVTLSVYADGSNRPPPPVKTLACAVAAYRALLREHRPEKVVVGGGSAGGNLAAALILRARDEQLPLSAGAVLRTPEVDLTESGDSFRTNMGVDTIATASLMPVNLLYAGEHNLNHPYLSPLFGDFSKGFPPSLLSAGTRDLFLSNAVRMHRALRAVGVRAELHLFEGAPHAGFRASEETSAAPEDEDLDREVRRFTHALWGARS